MQENVADAVGMDSFTEDYEGLNLPWRSSHYSKTCNNVLTDVNRADVSWRLPGGGYVSDIKDATLFMKGMLEDEFISEPSKSEMYQGQAPGGGYGYGFYRSFVGGTRMIEHGGNQPGTNNLMGFFPSEGKGIIILCNSDHYSRYRILDRIADALGISNNPGGFNLNSATECNEDSDDGGCRDEVDDIFSGVWIPGNAKALFRRGYTSDAFVEERDQLSAQGYTLVDFEPYRKDGKVLWDGVFRKENRQIIT